MDCHLRSESATCSSNFSSTSFTVPQTNHVVSGSASDVFHVVECPFDLLNVIVVSESVEVIGRGKPFKVGVAVMTLLVMYFDLSLQGLSMLSYIPNLTTQDSEAF